MPSLLAALEEKAWPSRIACADDREAGPCSMVASTCTLEIPILALSYRNQSVGVSKSGGVYGSSFAVLSCITSR